MNGSVEAIYAMLHEVRREVLLELKGQHEVVNEILSRLTPKTAFSASGLASAPAKAFRPVQSHTPKGLMMIEEDKVASPKSPHSSPPSSPKECEAVANKSSDAMEKKGHGSGNRHSITSVTGPENGDRRSRRNSGRNAAGRLFSTFSHYDLALQDVAERVEGVRNRLTFGESSGFSITSQKMPLVQKIVHTHAFDVFCAVVVMSNSVFLGIEVQLSIQDPGELPQYMQIVTFSYAGFFLLELLLRVMADGLQIFCNDDWIWGWLDLFVVTISIWEVVADVILVLEGNGSGQNSSVEGVSSLRALRIVRITRIIRVARLMRVFRFVMAFRTLITSIAFTLKSLFWALMLLFVIVYVFAVLFAQVVNDYVADPANPELPPDEFEKSQQYFSSLVDTMISLFMCIANGVNWENVVAPLKVISPAWTLLFVFYISFTQFAVLNVVTGVFCQSAIESAQNDHATMVQSILKNKEMHIAKIQALFNQLGTENTGVITFNNFTEKINTPGVRAYFELLGLDVWDAWSFFKMLDMDDSGDVEVEEFLMGCLRTRGSAKGIDVGKLIHDQTWLIKNQGKFAHYVEQEMQGLNSKMNDLAGICKTLLLETEHPLHMSMGVSDYKGHHHGH